MKTTKLKRSPPREFLQWVIQLPKSRGMDEMQHFASTGEVKSKAEFYDFLFSN